MHCNNIYLSLFVVLSCLLIESLQHRHFDRFDSDELVRFKPPTSEPFHHVHLHHGHFHHGDRFHHQDRFQPKVPSRNKGRLPTYAETLKFYRMRSLLRLILRNWLGKVDNFYSLRYLQRLKQKLRKLHYNKNYGNFRKYDSVFKTPNEPDIIDRIVTDMFEKKEDENISNDGEKAVVLSEKEDAVVDEIESLLGSEDPTPTEELISTTTTTVTPTTTSRVTPTTTTVWSTTTDEEPTRPRLIVTKTRVGFKPNTGSRNWSKFLQRFNENKSSVAEQRMVPSKFTKLDNFLDRLNKN